jgi:hypothetical protein
LGIVAHLVQIEQAESFLGNVFVGPLKRLVPLMLLTIIDSLQSEIADQRYRKEDAEQLEFTEHVVSRKGSLPLKILRTHLL